MTNHDLRKLYYDICRKAFNLDPIKTHIRFKKMKHDLANVLSYANKFGEPRAKLRVLKKLNFDRGIVGGCLIHEIAHLVSGQHNHNDKFYRALFRAAKTKYGRKFF